MKTPRQRSGNNTSDGPAQTGKTAPPPAPSWSSLYSLAGCLVTCGALVWPTTLLGEASTNSAQAANDMANVVGGQSAPAEVHAGPHASDATQSCRPNDETPDSPREIIQMLDLRKQELDRREAALRQSEQRLSIIRSDIEQILSKNEDISKQLEAARLKQQQQAKAEQERLKDLQSARERQAQEQKAELAKSIGKMYEAMPVEEAAERLERLPDRKAIEILRQVKGKTAGAILAQVTPQRAAKLSEQLLSLNP